jgi:hypothetical protein
VFIRGQYRQALHLSLRDQRTIDWIAMGRREPANAIRVADRYCESGKSISLELSRQVDLPTELETCAPPSLSAAEIAQQVFWQRSIEVARDVDPAGSPTRRSFAHPERHQPREGLASLGDDHLFAGGRTINELGETGLGVVDVDGLGHAQP